eukprot:65746-Chlamydomonas_euryale.AAC.3
MCVIVWSCDKARATSRLAGGHSLASTVERSPPSTLDAHSGQLKNDVQAVLHYGHTAQPVLGSEWTFAITVPQRATELPVRVRRAI